LGELNILYWGKTKLVVQPHIWVLSVMIVALAITYYYGIANIYEPSVAWFRNLVYYEYVYSLNGCLFTIPFLYATVVFWWRGSLATLLISEAVMLPYIIHMAQNSESLIRNIIYSFIPFLIIGFITMEFKWREKERRTLAEREAERQFYTTQIFQTQEHERQRIAQELHDDTLQMLYVIARRAQEIVPDENTPNIQKSRLEAEWVRKSILDVADGVRRISIDLRPSILDDLSLVPAIRWMVDRLNQDGGPSIQLTVNGVERKMRSEIDVMIFRIIQEALNNARKHAQANSIRVILEFTADLCKIAVQDDGKGFLLPQRVALLATEGKLGLIGMQQRAQLLGGIFDIKSEPGMGTTLVLEVKG
jgi:two-component system, NarL family, sensor histidine kinase DegS